MRNLIRALRGKPVELSPKQEAKMAAAQAKADAIIAEREAAGRKATEEAAQFMAARGGGASIGGPAPGPAPSFDPSQPLPPVRDMFKQAFEGFRDSVGETFDDRAGIIDPGPGANMNRPPPEVEDPAERARVAAAERDAREQARAAYQDEVLHARLDQRSDLRPPLDTEYRPPPSFLVEVFDMFNPLDPVHALPQIFNRNERPQLGPYCGSVEG